VEEDRSSGRAASSFALIAATSAWPAASPVSAARSIAPTKDDMARTLCDIALPSQDRPIIYPCCMRSCPGLSAVADAETAMPNRVQPRVPGVRPRLRRTITGAATPDPLLRAFRLAGHRYEAHGDRALDRDAGLRAAVDFEHLIVGSDRDHETSAGRELLEQRGRDLSGRGGHQNGIERRGFRPATIAVADAHVNALVSEPSQGRFRTPPERLDDLDRVDVLGHLREHGRLVARSGSDLEHPGTRTERRELRHERDDVGLADRLRMTDGQGAVV